MAQILVRDIDPEVLEQLKQRAKRNNRSLSAEVKTIIEQRRWSQLQRVQAEVHQKVLDRLGTNEQLGDYRSSGCAGSVRTLQSETRLQIADVLGRGNARFTILIHETPPAWLGHAR